MSTVADSSPTDLPPASVRVPMQIVAYTGAPPRADTRALAAEAPVNLVYGSVPHAVMMATPADLEDFAYGFSLTEGIIESASEIRSTRIEVGADGLSMSSWRQVFAEAAAPAAVSAGSRIWRSSRTHSCGMLPISESRCRRSPPRSRALMRRRFSAPRPGRSTRPPGHGSTAPWRPSGRMSAATMLWIS
jgi:hypothetical protein